MQKNSENITSFICTEARYPSRQCALKSWGLGRSLAAQTAQTHVLAVVAPPAPAAQISDEASAWPPALTLRHFLVRLVTRTFRIQRGFL
jgi:hypothetical protein